MPSDVIVIVPKDVYKRQDEARASGYEEFMPPTLVNTASGYGTGQLPDKEGQMYHCEVDDLYLIRCV